MKGQDILVLLKLAGLPKASAWTYSFLANSLGISVSESHAAVRRCEECGLYNPHTKRPNRLALNEFLIHGLKYVFPARPGGMVQGLPTSYAAPPLNKRIRYDARETPVMPLVDGPVRGLEIPPICRSAPQAAAQDDDLYQLLALLDALRTGRARERKLASEALTSLLAA